jgi:hypothetical protein
MILDNIAVDLMEPYWVWEVDGTNSELCPMAGFRIGDAEP